VLQLDSVLMKETTEKVGHRNPEPALGEVSKRHRLPRLQEGHHLIGRGSSNLLRQKETLHHEAL
jgi:hypothetical protein